MLPGRVVACVPVPGGITDTIWRVTLADGSHVILRWVEPERFGEDGRQFVVREALGCRLTADAPLPSPRLIASDPNGVATGGWANLTTFRPGRVRLEGLGPAAVVALAGLALRVHAVGVPSPADRPPPYSFWGAEPPTVPAWASRPRLWEQAIERVGTPVPPTPTGLIHRDFHPGNTLWQGDVVTGLIDWAETAWGPPDLDVAHACSNFAMLQSVESAIAFRTAYVAQGGTLDPDPEVRAYWQLRDICGFLPDPAPVVVALTRQRPDLDLDGVRRRLEDLLARTLWSL